MNATTNLYEVLGVSETAGQEDIKKAYRKLSLQYHPDRNNNSPESTAKFQAISSAYDVIGNDDKRRQYDMQNKMTAMGGNGMGMGGGNGMGMGMGMPFGGMPFGMPGMPTFFATSDANMDPSELLNFFSNNIFGGGGGATVNGIRVGPNMFNMDNLKRGLAKPTPIIINETIPISKAYTGFNMPIEVTRWILENNVKREETETIYLPIPCGVDNNEIIILREKGNILSDTNKGDIKVFIKIENNTEFVRNGLDLIYNKSITLKDALCGFVFDMTYLDGRVYKINNNSGNVIANNYNKVLPGMGMKREQHVGNLIINFTVAFPEKLTEEQINGLRAIL